MKIHLDNVAQFGTGPGTFGHRLARRLFESGHEVTFECQDAAVSLVFIEPSGAPVAPKVVQRLDGIWFRPQDFHTKNVGIKALYQRADAVVFQSEFDKGMATRWWGRPKLDRVIYNGIELNPVTELTIPSLIQLRAQYDRIYVCSSNWHPQKRLKANIRLFQHLQKQQPNSCLIVLGNPDMGMVPGPHVFYAGAVPPEVYMEIYSAANWMLHLAWADHCPNVVVEALSQGTPVVCSEVGGTKELVGDYGVVLHEDPYNFELADYDRPPSIDVTQITNLPGRMQMNDYISTAAIDIVHVAQEYVKLFERVIKCIDDRP